VGSAVNCCLRIEHIARGGKDPVTVTGRPATPMRPEVSASGRGCLHRHLGPVPATARGLPVGMGDAQPFRDCRR